MRASLPAAAVHSCKQTRAEKMCVKISAIYLNGVEKRTLTWEIKEEAGGTRHSCVATNRSFVTVTVMNRREE